MLSWENKMETELRAGGSFRTRYFDQTGAAAFGLNFRLVGIKQQRAFLR